MNKIIRINKFILFSLIITLLILPGCNIIIEANEASASNISGLLKVHYIDVGQADAVLIQQVNQDSTRNMLIDAANNGDGTYLVDYLKKAGVNSLDYVIGTHPHADHIGALDDIINNFQIGILLMPKLVSNTRTFEDVMKAAIANDLKITRPIPASTYNLGDAEFTILAPNSDKYSSLNDYSIVNRLVFGNNSFIFTGDAESISEKEILKAFSKRELESDVLKLGHHGSSSSTSDDFLNAVNPKYGVISCGLDNSYGHPHQEIMIELNRKNVEVLRTDKQGTIIITSDGIDLSIEREFDLDIDSNPNDISISKLDKIGELVNIENTGQYDIDISGWKLVSVRGNQEFIFPNHILKSKGRVTVGGYDSRDKSDFIWEIGRGVWSNSQSDPAELYDDKGNLISIFED